jgi:C4-dicarboxylate transporter DctM subunit
MIDPLIGAAIGIAIFLILLTAGMPIFAALGLGGVIGILLIEGFKGLIVITTVVYGNAYSFSILAITLFVFMGNLLVYHNMGEDMYDVVYKWLGRFKGGLSIVSTMFGAMFGFMCGSSVAGVATVGGICLPEMEKRGYDRRLSLGTLALSGSLAGLIPPSLLMILYAIVSDASLGKLFIAGIGPGLALAVLMVIYVVARVRLNPAVAPAGPSFPWRARFKSLLNLVPLVVIFFSVIGGLYMGIWSPTEAGATGAIASFLVCLAYRRVKWKTIKRAGLDTVKTFVMIYMLLFGAGMVAHLFFISGISHAIGAVTAGLALPSWLIIIFMWLVLMMLGCFLDPPAIILIAVPVFLPIVESLGFDPVWFGVVMVLASEMAQLTPPVGMGLFIMHGIAPKGTTFNDCVIGSLPYVGLLWILLGLLIVFPGIAMWLPGMMRGG